MLQVLLHIIICSVVCINWGIPVYLALRRYTSENYWFEKGGNIVIFLFFSGLLTISLFSSWVILFIPLKFNLLLILTIVVAFFTWAIHRKEIIELSKQSTAFNLKSFPAIFTLSSIVLLLLLGTLKPVNPDTQLYHLQIIRWTQEYGVVPGIANIYPRLGLGSNWFNLISFFNIPAFNHQNFTFLNTTITIWFLAWLINKWRYYTLTATYKNHTTLSLFYFLLLCYFLFDWQLLRDTANSTAYDFIVTILIIFCLSYFIETILSKEELRRHSIYFVFLSFSVITFKLSGIFLLVFLLFALINERSIKLLLKSFLLFTIVLTPVLIKNHISSGYIFFPLEIAIGNPEWKLPPLMTEHFKEYIINANRYYNQEIGIIETFNKTNFNWIPFWFNGILFKHKLLLALSLTSILLLFIKVKKNIISSFLLKQFLLALWVMIFAWFFLAPDPRFSFGFLMFSAFLPISILLGHKIPAKIYNILFLTISMGILIYGYTKIDYLVKNPIHFIWPVENDKPSFNLRNLNGLSFNEPKIINNNWNNRCFFTPLPCICEKNPYLLLRGKRIKDGFIMNTPDSNFIKRYNY